MADDQILHIGAEFDVSPIIAGATQAGAAFDQLKVKFQGLAVQAETAGNTVQAQAARFMAQGMSANEAASALVNLGTAEREAATAAAAIAAEAGIAGPAVEQVAAAATHAGTGFRGMTSAMGAARVEMGALEGSAGMMAGGLARVAAGSALLAPLISAAFPVFAAYALVEILMQVVKGFDSASAAVAGYTKAVQEAEKEDIKFSEKTEGTALTLGEWQRKLHENLKETGALAQQTFNDKWVKASEDAMHATTALGVAAKVLQDPFKLFTPIGTLFTAEGKAADQAEHLRKVNEELMKGQDALAISADRVALSQINVNEAAAKAAIPGDRVAQLQLEINALKEKQRLEIDIANHELAQKAKASGGDFAAARAESTANIQAKYKPEAERLETEKNIEAGKQSIELQTAMAEKKKTITEAAIAFDESATRREYEDHRITIEKETSELVNEENRRIVAVRAFYDEETRIAAAKGKLTGADVKPELTKISGQREAEEEKSRAKIAEIQAKGVEDEFRRDQEHALHAIEIDKQIAEADDNLATHRAELALRKADTPPEIKAAEAEYVRATTKAIEDQIAAIERENAMLAKDPSEAAAAKVAESQVKIHALKMEDQRKDLDIQEETKRRTDAYYSQQLNNEITTIEEQARISEDGERRMSEDIKRQFDDREINSRQYVARETDLAQREYTEKAAALAKEMELVKAAADADVISEEQKAKRLEDIWKREAEAQQQMLNQITHAQEDAAKKQQESINRLAQQWGQDWTRMANEVLTGREKIGTALVQLAGQMELQMIDKGIQLVVQKTATYLLELLASHVSFLAQLLGIQTAGSSVEVAKGAVTATAEISQQAGVAGAEAFASALPTAPFPANMAIAAAAQAAAISDVMANVAFVGAFEKGGEIPATGLAMVHKGEGILTAQQMTTINNSTNSRNDSHATSARRTTINNYFPDGSKMSHEDIVKSVRMAIRRGEIGL